MIKAAVAVLAMLLASMIVPATSNAADIKGLFPVSLEHAAMEIVPQFERSSGHKIAITYGTAGGIATKIRSGEVADVAIATAAQMDDLEKGAKIVAGSNVGLAKVGAGVLVRKGASKPDISSVDRL
jgi:molybdate transport system substrate-binding protein